MIKLSDYIFRYLADYGVRHLFLLTGGGAMHLNDSVRKESRIKYLCNHHEQACAIAAEGYARVTGKIGVLNVTTGPGGINALNGVFGAWTDSIPMLVISGQVKRETCSFLYSEPVMRQLGDQEADIVRLAKSITKYAVVIENPNEIKYHLQKALHLAVTGRPGPCWIDVPMDIQASIINEDDLIGYDPADEEQGIDIKMISSQCRDIIERIRQSERPVILAGTGVRLSGALDLFYEAIGRLGIPVTTAWTAIDLLDSNDALYCGRPGTVGDRAGNFAVQNSDLLLVLGSRLNIRQVSYNWKSFARHAYKIQVDADASELDKPTVKPDMPVLCDIKVFLDEFNKQLDESGYRPGRHSKWLEWCKERVKKYPVVLPRHYEPKKAINPYLFIKKLFEVLDEDDVIVCGNGSACVVTFQAASIKKGQRVFGNSGCASMGYDLPAAIGAAVARGGKRVICIAGDGSLQMNIQELQTVVHYNLPLKIFVMNNNGYLSIRSSQVAFFDGFIGEGPESGVTFPDLLKLGGAYGLKSLRLGMPDWENTLKEAINFNGAVICDVVLDPTQPFEPKLSSRQLPDGRIVSSPLEDLYPFLSRDELYDNLLIPPMDD
jgi:acetolactate synthase I/II/III large subunit